jgi:hypothetical protein
MPDETETPPPPSGAGEPEMREALQQLTEIFQPARDGVLLGGLSALGSLSDPRVRDRLNAALQTLRSAHAEGGSVQASSTVVDLRGTEAGEAIRRALGMTGVGPAQVYSSAEAADVQVTVHEPMVIEAGTVVRSSETIEAPTTVERPRPSAPLSQPSLVEDAGGGLFGWLGRLFGPRR